MKLKSYSKYIFGLSLLIGATGLVSCSDEEKLTPSESISSFFMVDPNDNSPEATLRRDFFEKTGMHLLFNDTLKVYTDEFGIDRIETVGFEWNITSDGEEDVSFDLLQSTEERKKATEAVLSYFIPYINVEGGQFKPYSIFLCTNIYKVDNSTYRYGKASFLSSWRCFGINVQNWLDAEDATEARTAGLSLLKDLANTKLKTSSPELADFFAVCEKEYDEVYIANLYPEWMDDQDIEIIYEAGFLRYYADYYGEADYDEFLSEKNDLASFMTVVFENDEAGFHEQWADYPKIIQKYDLLRAAVSDLGINFNAVK